MQWPAPEMGSRGPKDLPSQGKTNPLKDHPIPLTYGDEGVLPQCGSCNSRDGQGNENCEIHQTRKFVVGIQTCGFPCCVL